MQKIKFLTAALFTIAAIMTNQAAKAAKVVNQESCSFVAGTKVQTSDGFKNIELIQQGDSIYGYNFSVDRNGFYNVKEVTSRDASDFIRINIPNDSIVVTPEHLFWVGDRWVEAVKLQANDTLVNPSQQPVKIISIRHVKTKNPTKVYNFSIDTIEDYYVSSKEVLTHNCSITKPAT